METQAESTTMMRESSLANAIADLETKLGPGQLQRFVEVCDRVIAQHGEDGFTDHFSNELLSSIDLISLAAVKGKKHVRGHVRGLQQETWGLRPWQLIAKFGCSALHSQTFVARLRTLSSISDYQSACTKIQAARQARLASDGCGKGIRRHDSFIPDDVQRAIDQFAQPYTPITHPRKRARDATDPCEDSASRERSIEIGRGIEAPSKRSWLSPDLESMPDELPDTYDSDVNVDADDPDGRIVFDDTDFFEQPDAISTPRNFTAAQLSTVHDNGKSYTLDMETHEEGIEGTENVGHNTQSLEHRANTSRAPNISVRMARKSIEVQNLGRLAEATSQVSSVETSQGDRGKHDEKDHEQQAMVKATPP
nr:hypothetical protein CFP56_64718 [Quercus suber]